MSVMSRLGHCVWVCVCEYMCEYVRICVHVCHEYREYMCVSVCVSMCVCVCVCVCDDFIKQWYSVLYMHIMYQPVVLPHMYTHVHVQ